MFGSGKKQDPHRQQSLREEVAERNRQLREEIEVKYKDVPVTVERNKTGKLGKSPVSFKNLGED